MEKLIEEMIEEMSCKRCKEGERKFEKVSVEEAIKEIVEEKYEEIQLPRRGSKYSAGYDFYSPKEVVIPGRGTAKIGTCIKCNMEDDDVLMIVVRSSLGFKKNVRLANTVGVIDKDYYENEENEGHIYIKLYNPNEEDVVIGEGERFAQGIFIKYGITIDDEEEGERHGGIGSTGV